ncbi:type II toxin-antitoxin system VapC family toxin [Rhodopila sp.]|uniref:type II toxin-antitoxin system VapC family toxin n=1 Tax=Rhodopila sp. TaxID=2480087 RepID=UPI003D12A47D
MVKALLDTNILVDYLRGLPQAKDELNLHQDKAISAVTWMEVLVGTPPGFTEPTRRFLDGFRLIEVDRTVAQRAVELRQAHRMKLPDAIVWASAQVTDRLLVTRDMKDFPSNNPGVRMPYLV